MEFRKLYTPEGEKIPDIPWEVYPRPQMRRNDWLSLNGIWTFEADDSGSKDICVPFCPESILSGYDGKIDYGRKMRYRRLFSIPESWAGRRILLHFGAVSNRCAVYANGKKVCVHENGYLAFEADITDALAYGSCSQELTASEQKADRDHLLEVTVLNDLGGRIPTGKQRIKRGGMWYTPVSGIWQSVWLEPVPENPVRRLKITPDENGADIIIERCENGRKTENREIPASGNGVFTEAEFREGTVTCEGKIYPILNGHVRIEPDVKRLWSPESPYLYRFTVNCGEDSVESYFALRSISIKICDNIPRLCLNGKPYFFHGLLDQGYYSDGIYTPASPSLYEQDIIAMKELGFNMLRKHIKIEPEQFYYDCDRLGMIVFQDMVNNGRYGFFHDTLLPTIGITNMKDSRMHKDSRSREEFLKAMEMTVQQLYNHPCICYWTIFNEGWGQFEADRAYDRLKALDPGRIADPTSGWFHQNRSDVDSLHVYFKKLRLGKKADLPQVLSEFGGYVYKIPEHSFNLEKTYGYRILKDRQEFIDALRHLYTDEVLPLVKKGLSAVVYTQVSDVEDETNGLLTYDRRVRKIDPKDFIDISRMVTAGNFHGSCEADN